MEVSKQQNTCSSQFDTSAYRPNTQQLSHSRMKPQKPSKMNDAHPAKDQDKRKQHKKEPKMQIFRAAEAPKLFDSGIMSVVPGNPSYFENSLEVIKENLEDWQHATRPSERK